MPENPSFVWPPPFTVRISPRAKYARLRVLPGRGLEVVLPRQLRPECAADIVERHRDWVCKTLPRVCPASPPEPDIFLPREMLLHGGTVARPVVCRGEIAPHAARTEAAPEDITAGETAPETAAAVLLPTARQDAVRSLHALQAWTRRYAAGFLARETAALAGEYHLAYSALRVRRQKSRWGSCTAAGALNLNTCLVFLPRELARHVILHELAHTRHLNHGQGFWQTLFAMEPDALRLDKRLRTAWRYVPAWMWGPDGQ